MPNKTVFITGTNRGLGKAFVLAFADAGYDVIAHARKETPEFVTWCRETSVQQGVVVTPICFDMTDSDAMKAAVRELLMVRKLSVDVLVNNAGVAHGGLFQMTSMAKIREVFDINLFSAMELTQLFLRPMIRKGKGAIINIGSISGIDMKVGNCAYGLSKAAIMAFTRTLAAECGPKGVRVNAIAPGLAATDMAGQMEEQAGREMLARSVMNRLARPDEIARVAVFLASDDASFVNGQIVNVDGGRA